jgi:hypothetical protein
MVKEGAILQGEMVRQRRCNAGRSLEILAIAKQTMVLTDVTQELPTRTAPKAHNVPTSLQYNGRLYIRIQFVA